LHESNFKSVFFYTPYIVNSKVELMLADGLPFSMKNYFLNFVPGGRWAEGGQEPEKEAL
jgi:hypothetical protein